MDKMRDYAKTRMKATLRPRKITLQTLMNKNYNSCLESEGATEVRTATRDKTGTVDTSVLSLSPCLYYKE